MRLAGHLDAHPGGGRQIVFAERMRDYCIPVMPSRWSVKGAEKQNEEQGMTGYLKSLSSGEFCVEYADRGVYVRWEAGEALNKTKPMSWIDDAHPKQPQVPENMLRVIIGSKARFMERARIEKNKVELVGRLDDGGNISIGFIKGVPPRDLTESEQNEGVETVKQWARSYLRTDI